MYCIHGANFVSLTIVKSQCLDHVEDARLTISNPETLEISRSY